MLRARGNAGATRRRSWAWGAGLAAGLLGLSACSQPIMVSDGGARAADVALGPLACTQLNGVRSAAPMSLVSPALLVERVLVTYIREPSSTGVRAFTVQCSPTGPGVVVWEDATTLGVRVGDVVTFEVTEMGFAEPVTVENVQNFAIESTGVDITPFLQDLSAEADLGTRYRSYEAEVVTVHGTIAGPFTASGGSYVVAPLETTGTGSPTPLTLRVEGALVSSLGLVEGCELTVGPVALWAWTGAPQLNVSDPAHLHDVVCP